jgi:hypothetical protein
MFDLNFTDLKGTLKYDRYFYFCGLSHPPTPKKGCYAMNALSERTGADNVACDIIPVAPSIPAPV